MVIYQAVDWTINYPWTTTGSTTATNPVWQSWVTAPTTTTSYTTTANITWDRWMDWHEPVMRTAEEEQRRADARQARREAEARAELEFRQREARREEERAVANARAMDLLNLLVAPGERFDDLEYIQLVGSDGQLYRIEMHRRTVHGNIVRIDEHGCMLGRACVAPEMYDRSCGVLPTADGWVGQYLGLKHDAEEFLSYANWSNVRGCQQPPALRVA